MPSTVARLGGHSCQNCSQTQTHLSPESACGCQGCSAHGRGSISEVVRFGLDDGLSVLVEVEEDSVGIERVSRGQGGVVEAGHRLTEALGSVRDAARASMEVLQTLSPGQLELEFGVKLAGEAGAIIAKTAAEGHFIVKLTWAPG